MPIIFIEWRMTKSSRVCGTPNTIFSDQRYSGIANFIYLIPFPLEMYIFLEPFFPSPVIQIRSNHINFSRMRMYLGESNFYLGWCTKARTQTFISHIKAPTSHLAVSGSVCVHNNTHSCSVKNKWSTQVHTQYFFRAQGHIWGRINRVSDKWGSHLLLLIDYYEVEWKRPFFPNLNNVCPLFSIYNR